MAQDLPPIQNFGPLEYNGEYQNWAITQADSKKIYVANHSSLLEFDGVRWRKFSLPSQTIIRSVKAYGDRLYTGCYGEFGFWLSNAMGLLEYTSLSDKFKHQLLDNEEFWDILVFDTTVLFQSLERIYMYDLEADRLHIIEAKTEKAKLFAIGNNVYFQEKDKGLFTLENGKPLLISDAGEFQKGTIINIVERKNGLLIVTYDGHFYTYNSQQLERMDTDIDRLGLKLYSSTQLHDGSIGLGTISDGFYQLSATGKLIKKVNQSNGLHNNTVLSLFEDQDQNLWLGLDNGISVLNLNSPFKEYSDPYGNLGLVYAALNHNGYLYLGTNQGLFVKPIGTTGAFILIKGTEGQVWSLQVVNNTIFCGHNSGTFVVTDKVANLVSSFPGTWVVKSIPSNPNLVMQGNYNGLSILSYTSGNWSLRNVIQGFDISSRFFEMDSLQVVVNHENRGLYYLKLDDDLRKTTTLINTPRLGYGSSIFRFNGDLLYKTHLGIYSLSFTGDKPASVSGLNALIFGEGKEPTSRIIQDSHNNRLWYLTENGMRYIDRNPLTGKAIVGTVAVPSSFVGNLGVAGFENISHIAPNTYLVGVSNGYLTMDLDRIVLKDHRVEIGSVRYGTSGKTNRYANLNTSVELDYGHNNLEFEYSVPAYDKYDEVIYRYRLKGLETEWRQWSTTPTTRFSNLAYGDYEFNVEAQIGQTVSKNIARYFFTITKPWYATNSAIVGYAFGFALVFFVVHRSYKKYYKRKHNQLLAENVKALEQQRLQEQAKISKILNEKLCDEIEGKNRELAISTMGLVRKNEFLSAIKKQLSSVDHKGNAISSVIKKIDRNINSEEDWKFFEVAFNNADKDFLKRLKAKHEDLTHTDLKLCAYLRLNLSSKEIAPLLNITLKSVEMKRYRLRQKLHLTHGHNLMDYILDF